MRPFEILFLLCTTAGTLLHSRRFSNFSRLAGAAAGVFLLLHLLIEGWRWQMVPGCLAWLFLLEWLITAYAREIRVSRPSQGVLPEARGTAASGKNHLLIKSVLSLLILLSFFAGIILPVFRFPAPEGPWQVGRSRIFLDLDLGTGFRGETELIVFAPVLPESGTAYIRSPWLDYPAPVAASRADIDNFPAFTWSHLRLIRTASLETCDEYPKRTFPVVFALHGGGRGESAAQLTHINENLASHGFIVIAVNHAEISQICGTGENSFVTGDPSIDERWYTEVEADSATIDRFVALYAAPVEEQTKAHPAFLAAQPTLVEVTQARATALRLILDEQERHPDRFPWNADFGHLGIYGYSLGGSVALDLALKDVRFDAAANLDGMHYAPLPDTAPCDAAILMLYSESTARMSPRMNRFVEGAFSRPFISRIINNANHGDFGPHAFISPLASRIAGLGTIGGMRMRQITTSYLAWFFDTTLGNKEVSEPLFGEVRIPEPDRFDN